MPNSPTPAESVAAPVLEQPKQHPTGQREGQERSEEPAKAPAKAPAAVEAEDHKPDATCVPVPPPLTVSYAKVAALPAPPRSVGEDVVRELDADEAGCGGESEGAWGIRRDGVRGVPGVPPPQGSPALCSFDHQLVHHLLRVATGLSSQRLLSQ